MIFLFLIVTLLLFLGKNNGKGYYIYEKGSQPKPDPAVLPIIEQSRRMTNIMPGGKVLLFSFKYGMLFTQNKIAIGTTLSLHFGIILLLAYAQSSSQNTHGSS